MPMEEDDAAEVAQILRYRQNGGSLESPHSFLHRAPHQGSTTLRTPTSCSSISYRQAFFTSSASRRRMRFFRLAPLGTRRDIAVLGLIHRCVLGRGPSHFQQFIKFDVPPVRCTRQSAQCHRFQLCSMVDGTQKEITRRSLLGMLDVYNMLPVAGTFGSEGTTRNDI